MTTRRLSITMERAQVPDALRADSSVTPNAARPLYGQIGIVIAADATNGAQIAINGVVIVIPQVGETPLYAGQTVRMSQGADGAWRIIA